MVRALCVVLILTASLVYAEPVGRAVGVGTRAIGMAGNFTALSNDYSAAYWNPAGMAFVPVREFHATLDVGRLTDSVEYGGRTSASALQRYRLGSVGLLRSVPTVRGGFALAAGWSTPWLLDDVNNASGNDTWRGDDTLWGYQGGVLAPSPVAIEKSYHRSRGACGLWNLGAGWQIAPQLGFGVSMGLLLGSDARKIELLKRVNGNLFEDVTATGERSFLSYDARVGLLYMPRRELSIGCRLELPRVWSVVSERYSELDAVYGVYDDVVFGSLLSPYCSGAIGMAIQLPAITITSDFSFRSPVDDAAAAGTDFEKWKTGAGIGVEMPVKWLAGVVRGGYAFHEFVPATFIIKWEDNAADREPAVKALQGQHHVAAGYSLFMGSSVSLDLAYTYYVSAFTLEYPDWQNIQTVRNSHQRGMATLSIRY